MPSQSIQWRAQYTHGEEEFIQVLSQELIILHWSLTIIFQVVNSKNEVCHYLNLWFHPVKSWEQSPFRSPWDPRPFSKDRAAEIRKGGHGQPSVARTAQRGRGQGPSGMGTSGVYAGTGAGAEFNHSHPGGSDYDKQLRSRTDTEEVVFDACRTLCKSTDHLAHFSGCGQTSLLCPTGETEKNNLHVCI